MFINENHKLANEALKRGELQFALELFNKALDESPMHPEILSDRGVLYLHLNDADNCFRDLLMALETEPERSYRYSSLAYARNHFGDIDQAIEDYRKAVELDPDDAVAHNNLGLLLEQKGYQQEAQEKFERADKLSKMEDKLFDLVDELEGKEPELEKTEQNEKDEMNKPEEQNSTFGEMKKLFTSRKQFREFINFVKNGFKIK